MADTGSSDRGDKTNAFRVSIVAATVGFLLGYHLAVVSGAIIFLQKQFSLSPEGG